METDRFFAIVCESFKDFIDYRDWLLRRDMLFVNTYQKISPTQFIIDNKMYKWFNGDNLDAFHGYKIYSIIKIGTWYKIRPDKLSNLELLKEFPQ